MPAPTTRNLIAAVIALTATVLAGATEDSPPSAGSYRVKDGRVDIGTYRGWLTYQIACRSCHGPDATGSRIAPDLRRSLATMNMAEFSNKVRTRYRVSLGLTESLLSDPARQAALAEIERQTRGEWKDAVMPAWQSDAAIDERVLDLHAYLRARSEGALGPGQPVPDARTGGDPTRD